MSESTLLPRVDMKKFPERLDSTESFEETSEEVLNDDSIESSMLDQKSCSENKSEEQKKKE
jgi:hypothetical protein